ncbi:MAG: hypothetical protein JXB00_15505 [Bacteroidales bacterium]|nr:hypothetical protein [Bacteroidales bacterium]
MRTLFPVYKYFRIVRLSFLLIYLCINTELVTGQQSIIVNTMVRPPYSTLLYNYSELTRVIITTPYTLRVTLSVHIKGDNGIDLITGPDYNPAPVLISANEVNQLSGIDLSGYFDAQNLIAKGVSLQEIIDNGLPEGSYQICVRVKGPDGYFISPEEPAGCSNFFNIRYGDPPLTINPQCGAKLSQSAVQNVVFSWTPATNAPAWTQYTLKIVELLDSTQNPNAAMLSATEPAFFETTLQGAFSFFYGPSQPVLEKGKIYAWQVIAEERETQAKFTNNGRSPVCWFKWDPFEMPSFSVVEPAENIKPGKAKISTISNVDPIPISIVNGKLNYKFKGGSAAVGLSQSTGETVNVQQAGISMLGDGLTYNQDNISVAGSKPLANIKVSLVMSYVLKGKMNNQEYDAQPIDMNGMRDDEVFMGDYPDHEKVLATTTTASDGSFSFMFMNTEQELGLVDDNAYWKSAGGEFFDMITGKIYKVIRLRVENKYYCSPDINIKLEPWQALDLGTVVSYVKSYNLKVHTQWTSSTFWDVKGGQGKKLDNVKTLLIRKYQVNNIPGNEGGFSGSGGALPKVLQTVYTQSDGTITLTNLVQHDPDNKQDRYYVKCEPDKNKGLYIFKQYEKPYYPIYSKDRKNFPFNSLRYEDNNSNMPQTVYDAYGENITWNSQLQVKTYELIMELYPDKPRIAGKVEAIEVSAKPMSNVTLMLLNNYQVSSNYNIPVRTAKTDANGYYEFDNLDVQLGEFTTEGPTQVIGPNRTIFCTPQGFKGQARNLGKLIWGQQEIQNFQMEPDGLLTGYIIDDRGNAVAADIQVDDLAFASTTMQFEYNQSGSTENTPVGGTVSGVNTFQLSSGGVSQLSYSNNSQSFLPTGVKQVFAIKAPSGKNRKITIIPKDPGYTTETYTVDIPKAFNAGNNQELKPYMVYHLKKRIRFLVAEKPAGAFYSLSSLKPVPNAGVTLKIPGADVTMVTDARGTVVFEFENNGSSFTFDIKAPDNVDLEDASYTISNVQDSKTTVIYPPALLKKATRITGKVSLGNAQIGALLEGATVYIDLGNGERIETKTNQNGTYTLIKVPKEPVNITVWASKPNAVPNIVSQSKQILLKDVNQLDFFLTTDKEIVIEDIYGFQVDIKSKQKQTDGTYLISGALINLPANPNFKTAETSQTIPFENLKIKKSASNSSNGIPIGIPAGTDFNTDITDLQLLMNDAFGVLQTPTTGTVLKVSSENNKGQIKGKAGILKTSFQYSDNYVSFQQNIPLYLTIQPGNTQSSVITITVNDYPAKKWGLTGANNTDIQFKLLDFNAKASKTSSWIEGDKIGLATTITTNEIQGMVPSKLSIALGELILRPTQIDPVTGTKPLAFKLEKWDFQSTGWSLQQQKKGVYIPQGIIKTGLIDVPAKNILITPDNFKVEVFEVSNLTFSGVTPLNILTQNNSFGYNPSTGSDKKAHWELRIIGTQGAPGVSISGLPGMEPGAELKFQSFSLLSNGEQQINMGNQQQELVFHKILKVKPLSFSGGDKYFEMSCNIDLNIPRIEPGSGVIRFSKPAAQVLFELYPFNVSFDGPGSIRFISGIAQGDQKLEASGYTAKGTIKDNEGINLKAKLHRTQTAAWIEVDPKGQKMPLGSGQTSLSDIEGKMEVISNVNDWSKFTFSGDMTGFKGMESNVRKTFTVHGSITADNESLGVKNMPGPFGGMAITYDIQNARFTGSIDIDKQIGPMNMKGAANIVVDGSGWYFLLGGQLTTPGIGNMAAGMLIGDYKIMPPEITQTLMQFAYNKNIPASFKTGISGFFFTGQKSVPIINIPNYEIELGVLSASLGLTAGLDGRVWMGFDASGNEYGIGAMAFAHAWFKASSITCTKLSAEARAELGATGVYQTNTGAFTVTGCGSFTISGSARQCFPTPCWDGLCCEGCIGGGISKGIRLDMLFDSNGNTSLDFSFGNCSGQSNMSGNW